MEQYSNIYISSNPIFLLHCLNCSRNNPNKKYLIIDKQRNLGGSWRVHNSNNELVFDRVHFIFLENLKIDKETFLEKFNNLLKIIDNKYILQEKKFGCLILPSNSRVNKMSFFDLNLNINLFIAEIIDKIKESNNIVIKNIEVVNINYVQNKYIINSNNTFFGENLYCTTAINLKKINNIEIKSFEANHYHITIKLNILKHLYNLFYIDRHIDINDLSVKNLSNYLYYFTNVTHMFEKEENVNYIICKIKFSPDDINKYNKFKELFIEYFSKNLFINNNANIKLVYQDTYSQNLWCTDNDRFMSNESFPKFKEITKIPNINISASGNLVNIFNKIFL